MQVQRRAVKLPLHLHHGEPLGKTEICVRQKLSAKLEQHVRLHVQLAHLQLAKGVREPGVGDLLRAGEWHAQFVH